MVGFARAAALAAASALIAGSGCASRGDALARAHEPVGLLDVGLDPMRIPMEMRAVVDQDDVLPHLRRQLQRALEGRHLWVPGGGRAVRIRIDEYARSEGGGTQVGAKVEVFREGGPVRTFRVDSSSFATSPGDAYGRSTRAVDTLARRIADRL